VTTHNTHNRHTSMHPEGFEPTVSASERPQNYSLDRAATGTAKPPDLSGLKTVWSLLPAKLILIKLPCNITFNNNNSKLTQYKTSSRPPRLNNTITAVRYFAGTPAISVHVRPTLFNFGLQV